MKNRWFQPILAAILIFVLAACSSPTPPTEFAPDGEIIQKAIALQLNQTEALLSQQLNASPPDLEISKIAVKRLEPVFVEELPAYHLQGTYQLDLSLPRQQVSQKNNPFDIYLQRQAEGKTWRLLKRELHEPNAETQWKSYLIQ
jgi:hypothetical protein